MTTRKCIYQALALILLVAFMLPACAPQPAVVSPATSATATAAPAPQYTLRVLHPQAPTTLNPHLSRSIKDMEPARIVFEPLAAFDKDGTLVPILAAEVPSLENAQLAQDGKSVTWKLRQDVLWSDGQPMTSEDVKFTYDYVTDPAVKAGTVSSYAQIERVETPDKFTVKINFKNPTPDWAAPFVGNSGVILPKHIFEQYKGANAASAPANTMPIGTGPYIVKAPGIKTQEVLLFGSQVVKTYKITFEPNPNYRFQKKIFFQKIIWRGGGTVDEAARVSLGEGSTDLAFDLDSVDTAKLNGYTQNANAPGQLLSIFGAAVERIYINWSDPYTASADNEYSSVKVPHPLFSDPKVRQAVAYAINRTAIAELYGANGRPTHEILVAPPQYMSESVFYEYDLAKAKALLDEAKYVDENGDGVREKNGVKMKMLFRAPSSPISLQALKIIQKDLIAIGIDTDIKLIDSSIFYDVNNPDSTYHFGADMMMFRYRSLSPDPTDYMQIWTCKGIPQKANNWAGTNYSRWCDPKYDDLILQAKTELNPAKRQAIFKQLNDMLVEDVVMIPVVWRAVALGVNKKLTGLDPTPWDSITWNIENWQFK